MYTLVSALQNKTSQNFQSNAVRVDYRQQGFTLIELMIVVVVIGILSAVAMPAYTDYVKRGKAAEATSTLADLRIKMEQYFQDHQQYTNVSVAVLAPCSPGAGTTKYFTYSCTTQTVSTYTISAAPIAGQGVDNFAFSVNEGNAKTSTFDGTVGATCWLTKKGGTC